MSEERSKNNIFDDSTRHLVEAMYLNSRRCVVHSFNGDGAARFSITYADAH